jgi:hypothetical protein
MRENQIFQANSSRAVKGESQSWGVLKRTGNVKAMES